MSAADAERLYMRIEDQDCYAQVSGRNIFHPHPWLKAFNHFSSTHNGPALKRMRKSIQAGTFRYCDKMKYQITQDSPPVSLFDDLDHSKRQAQACDFFDYEGNYDFMETAPESTPEDSSLTTKFSVLCSDCLVVAEHLKKEMGLNVCVLNMASDKVPGGGFRGGSGAQEENLHRRSNYHQVLEDKGKVFDPQRKWSYPLPEFGGVYSPSVTVFRSSEASGYQLLPTPFNMSFIALASYRRPALVKPPRGKGGEPRLTETFADKTARKIRVLLHVCLTRGHDALVLSAAGCGAFKNPPTHVAEIYKSVLLEEAFRNRFKYICFAIFDDHNSRKPHNPNGNFSPFLSIFSDIHTPLEIADPHLAYVKAPAPASSSRKAAQRGRGRGRGRGASRIQGGALGGVVGIGGGSGSGRGSGRGRGRGARGARGRGRGGRLKDAVKGGEGGAETGSAVSIPPGIKMNSRGISTSPWRSYVTHCQKGEFDVYIGRNARFGPPTWGNPFKMKDRSVSERGRASAMYRAWLEGTPEGKAMAALAKKELKGKILACHCSPSACHGDILAEAANT